MPFHTRITSIVKKHLANLEVAHDRRVVEAETRARRNLEKERIAHEREMAILKLQREKLALRKELSEAKIVTQKDKTATEKARQEAGDLTMRERLGVFGSQLARDTVSAYKALAKPVPKRRRKTASKRKASRR